MLTSEFSSHRVGFTRSCLAVGETSSHAALEDGLHQGLCRELIHYIVGARLVEHVIKSEQLVLQKLGQIDLLLGLVHDQLVFGRHAHDVDLLLVVLLIVERPLPNTHRYLVLHHMVGLAERVELLAVLELSDHLLELPIGVVLLALDYLLSKSPLVRLLLATLVSDSGDLLDLAGRF